MDKISNYPNPKRALKTLEVLQKDVLKYTSDLIQGARRPEKEPDAKRKKSLKDAVESVKKDLTPKGYDRFSPPSLWDSWVGLEKTLDKLTALSSADGKGKASTWNSKTTKALDQHIRMVKEWAMGAKAASRTGQLVRLAYENPELRADLLRLLTADGDKVKETAKKLFDNYIKGLKDPDKSKKKPEDFMNQAKWMVEEGQEVKEPKSDDGSRPDKSKDKSKGKAKGKGKDEDKGKPDSVKSFQKAVTKETLSSIDTDAIPRKRGMPIKTVDGISGEDITKDVGKILEALEKGPLDKEMIEQLEFSMGDIASLTGKMAPNLKEEIASSPKGSRTKKLQKLQDDFIALSKNLGDLLKGTKKKSSTHSNLVRLAYENPEMRADLLPLLKTAEKVVIDKGMLSVKDIVKEVSKRCGFPMDPRDFKWGNYKCAKNEVWITFTIEHGQLEEGSNIKGIMTGSVEYTMTASTKGLNWVHLIRIGSCH